MIINQKIRLVLDKEESKIIDSQSRMCSKVYNMLLELCNKDEENDYSNHYLEGRNLRNQVVKIKQENSYLYSVHSSPLKNAAIRLKTAFENFFNESSKNEYPQFHSNKKKWFSLLYDEPNKGIKIQNKKIRISLGYKLDENNKKVRLYLNGTIAEEVIKNMKVKNYRITKELNCYYLIVTLEGKEKDLVSSPSKTISIDPNHTNFFVGIDNEGKSIELNNLYMIKYFDKQIDIVKSKRDKCLKKSIECFTKDGTPYYISSRRYQRLDKALTKLYLKRKDQIKTALFTIAQYLCKNYDIIAIGDYVPTLDTAKYQNMHRAMLNQTPIGQFRQILEFVCAKTGKIYKKVNEANTTKTCSMCGHIESHDPSVRSFVCPNCGKLLYRDINSAINIGVKEKILSSSDYEGFDLSKPTYIASYSLRKQTIVY